MTFLLVFLLNELISRHVKGPTIWVSTGTPNSVCCVPSYKAHTPSWRDDTFLLAWRIPFAFSRHQETWIQNCLYSVLCLFSQRLVAEPPCSCEASWTLPDGKKQGRGHAGGRGGVVTCPPSAIARPPLESWTGIINAQKGSAFCFKIFYFSSF